MEISPKLKQWGVIAGGIIGIVSVIAIFAPADQTTTRRGPETIKNIFTPGNDRNVTIDAMAARIKLLEESDRDKKRELDKAKQELDRIRSDAGVSTDTQRQLAQIRSKQINLEKKQQDISTKYDDVRKDLKEVKIQAPPQATIDEEAVAGTNAYGVNQRSANPSVETNGQDVFQVSNPTTVTTSESESTSGFELSIQEVGEAEEIVDVEEEISEEEQSFYVPMGSILTGVLLNGLDAPTGVGANRDPFPVTVRIQKEAVLPNQFVADVIDCHAVMSGYGDLSSERVMLRAEGIACVREDGRTIEAKLEGYAAGEDGKAGLRGRLVTKQGQLVARSMIAGAMSGFSGAFDVSPIPVVNTGEQNSIQYADAFNSSTLQSGLVKGTQNSMDRIADWFLKMADAIVPVLELDAGREVDIMTSRGMRLVFK